MSYKVSVIIPTYKRGINLVKRAIESVLLQDYENIEIIVVDDNAKEELLQYRVEIENYIITLNNEKIIYLKNQKNLGGSLARNEGIKIATGQYITFLDDDDMYLERKITNQLEFMINNKLDMCFTDVKICDENNKVVDYRDYSNIKKYDKESLIKYHLTRHITPTNGFMYKTDVIKKIGMFPDAIMGQEFYLMYNTIEADIKIGYSQKCNFIMYRYKNDNSITTGPNKIPGEKMLYEFKKSNFHKLSFKEKIFVRFRHHIVLAVTYKREKKIILSIKESILAFLNSPIDSFIEFFSFQNRKKINS